MVHGRRRIPHTKLLIQYLVCWSLPSGFLSSHLSSPHGVCLRRAYVWYGSGVLSASVVLPVSGRGPRLRQAHHTGGVAAEGRLVHPPGPETASSSGSFFFFCSTRRRGFVTRSGYKLGLFVGNFSYYLASYHEYFTASCLRAVISRSSMYIPMHPMTWRVWFVARTYVFFF